MKINFTETEKRYFFEIDLEERISTPKLKVVAIMKGQFLAKIDYINGHRFVLTNEKQKEVEKLVRRQLSILEWKN